MERIRIFYSSTAAGLFIGIGGAVYLSMENRIAGAFLFSVGLFSILFLKLNLFTSKVGYIPFKDKSYLIDLLVTWLGNLLGTVISAFMLLNTKLSGRLLERVVPLAEKKMGDSFISIFILAFFCGMLMFTAAETYHEHEGTIVGAFAVLIPIMVYVLGSLEHVVADMFYVSLAGIWDLNAVLKILTVTLGNCLGALSLSMYFKIFKLKI